MTSLSEQSNGNTEPTIPAELLSKLANDQQAAAVLDSAYLLTGITPKQAMVYLYSTLITTQAGVVQDNMDNDLVITFSPPIPEPIFLMTNMWNVDGKSSDIGYSDLTPNGVTVRRGYSMSAGGLQDFSWIAFPKAVPTTTTAA